MPLLLIPSQSLHCLHFEYKIASGRRDRLRRKKQKLEPCTQIAWDTVKMQILIQRVWVWAWESAFPTGSQVMLHRCCLWGVLTSNGFDITLTETTQSVPCGRRAHLKKKYVSHVNESVFTKLFTDVAELFDVVENKPRWGLSSWSPLHITT